MEIFYKSLFDDVLVSIHCIFVSWTLAAYLVFLSYVVFKTPSRLPKSLKVMRKKPMKKGLLMMQRLLMMRTPDSISCVVSIVQHQDIVWYKIQLQNIHQCKGLLRTPVDIQDFQGLSVIYSFCTKRHLRSLMRVLIHVIK